MRRKPCFRPSLLRLNGWLALLVTVFPLLFFSKATRAQNPSATAPESVKSSSTNPGSASNTPRQIDWPVPRGNAESTGAVADDLPGQLSVRWEYESGEAIEATPVIADGIVFAGDVMGKLYAVKLVDGSELWTKDYDTGFMASPSVHDGIVYVGDVYGKFYALDGKSGEEKWSIETEGEISGSAAFAGDNVLVASQDGSLHCFAMSDGTKLWTYTTEDQIRCNPTVAGGKTFLGGCDGSLHVVDVNSGKAARDPLPLGGPTGSTPAAVGTKIVLPIMDGAILAFDYSKGESLWRYEDEERAQEYRSSGAIAKDLFIISSRNKNVDAISISTGKRIWRHTVRRRSDASPVVTGDSVWIASTDGRLVRLSIKDGKEMWVHEIRGAYLAGPAIAGNVMVIADDDGVVRCFGG